MASSSKKGYLDIFHPRNSRSRSNTGIAEVSEELSAYPEPKLKDQRLLEDLQDLASVLHSEFLRAEQQRHDGHVWLQARREAR